VLSTQRWHRLPSPITGVSPLVLKFWEIVNIFVITVNAITHAHTGLFKKTAIVTLATFLLTTYFATAVYYVIWFSPPPPTSPGPPSLPLKTDTQQTTSYSTRHCSFLFYCFLLFSAPPPLMPSTLLPRLFL